MQQPLVSVIIPIYNQGAFLFSTIESVTHQTHPHFELFLIDDGSTDGTGDICKEWMAKDSRIHYVRTANRGQAAARNRGIDLAKGEYIFFLDGDDLIHPKQLAIQIEALQKNPDVDIVYSAANFIDDQNQFLFETRNRDYTPPNFLAMIFVRYIPANFSSLLLKQECCKKQRFNEKYRLNEDYELIIRWAHHYSFKYIDMPLSTHRNHAHNISKNLIASHEVYQQILKNYGYPHIVEVIDASGFYEEEKKLLKGIILFYLDEFEGAIQMLKLHSFPIASFYEAGCYAKLGRLSEAEACYANALNQDSGNPGTYNNLGVIFYMKGDLDLAREYFQRALDLVPGYGDALENLNHLTRGDLVSPKFSWKAMRKYLLEIGSGQMQSSL